MTISAIQNDDVPPPALTIAALNAVKPEGNSGSTAFTFTVTRSGDLNAASSVAFAVTGSGANAANASDFGGTLPNGTVSFAANEVSKTVSFNVAGDTTVEPNEDFTVTLSNAINGVITTGSAGGTIQNDDVPPPALTIAALNAVKPEGNSGSTAFTFTVTRSGDLNAASSVAFAVTGSGANAANASDFGGTLPNGTVSFAANEVSKTVSFNVAGDTTVEPNEDFTVTLSNAINGVITTGSAGGTIQNDDVPLTISSLALSSDPGTDNNYVTGDLVQVSVTFTGKVQVTGIPQLSLNIGGVNSIANYSIGSDSTVLVFKYTIQRGDFDANGISLNANAINLNGGTITDVSGNFATITSLAVPDNANQMVNFTGGLFINGTNGPDILVGTNGDDSINGLGGDDTIIEFVGADRVNGGVGKDTIVIIATSTSLNTATNIQIVNVEVISAAGAASGVIINLHNQTENLTIIGSGNNDTITGSPSNNTINAGSGDDTIVGLFGMDIINGGRGMDMIVLTATSIALNKANNTQIVSVEALTAATARSSVIIVLSNQNEGFTITGSAFKDTITGSKGNDIISGGNANDIIKGGNGADRITGGNGVDTIDLGIDNKADHVVFNSLSEFGDKLSKLDIVHDSIDFGGALKALLDDGYSRGDIAWRTSAIGNNSNTTVNLNNLEALYLSGTTNDGVIAGNLINKKGVATEFNAEYNITVSNGEYTLLVINDNTAGSNQSAVWLYAEAGGAEIQASELQLIGMVNANSSMTMNDFHFG